MSEAACCSWGCMRTHTHTLAGTCRAKTYRKRVAAWPRIRSRTGRGLEGD